jgi:hypothetical protein
MPRQLPALQSVMWRSGCALSIRNGKDSALPTVCYAISSGSYSDYKINAVFSSKEKAEAKLNLFADGKIEEFPFDPEMAEAPAGMLPFACYSHKWDSATGEYVPCLEAFLVDYDSVVRAGNKVSAWAAQPCSLTYGPKTETTR